MLLVQRVCVEKEWAIVEPRCQLRKYRASPNGHQVKVSVSLLLCVHGGVSVFHSDDTGG